MAKKVSAIILGALTVAAVAVITVFGVKDGSPLNVKNATKDTTVIYTQLKEDNLLINDVDTFKEYALKNLSVDGENTITIDNYEGKGFSFSTIDKDVNIIIKGNNTFINNDGEAIISSLNTNGNINIIGENNSKINASEIYELISFTTSIKGNVNIKNIEFNVEKTRTVFELLLDTEDIYATTIENCIFNLNTPGFIISTNLIMKECEVNLELDEEDINDEYFQDNYTFIQTSSLYESDLVTEENSFIKIDNSKFNIEINDSILVAGIFTNEIGKVEITNSDFDIEDIYIFISMENSGKLLIKDSNMDINSKDNISITDKDQLILLESEKAVLQEELDILKEKSRINREERSKEARATENTSVKYTTWEKTDNSQLRYGTAISGDTSNTGVGALQGTLDSLNAIKKEIDIVKQDLKDTTYQSDIDYLNDKLSILRDDYKSLRDEAIKYAEAELQVINNLDETNAEDAKLIESIRSVLDNYSEMKLPEHKRRKFNFMLRFYHEEDLKEKSAKLEADIAKKEKAPAKEGE